MAERANEETILKCNPCEFERRIDIEGTCRLDCKNEDYRNF